MGMFDRVWADCPKCGAKVEFQSKAGKCELIDYDMDSVPPEIARDINADAENCECGYTVKLMPKNPIQRVALTYLTSEEL